MPRIEWTCKRCGAKVVSQSVDEVLAWDKAHQAVCLGLHRERTDA